MAPPKKTLPGLPASSLSPDPDVFLGGASGKKRRGGADDGIDEAAEMEESRRGDDEGEDEEIPPEILSVLEEDKFGKEVRIVPQFVLIFDKLFFSSMNLFFRILILNFQFQVILLIYQ